MSDKPVILTFIHYYIPGYKSGGPLRTIANMVDRLGDEFHFKIITTDRDALDTQPYPDIKVDSWNRVGKADVYYCSPGKQSIGDFKRVIQQTECDVLYLNSFFDPTFTGKPLVLRWLRRLPDRPVVLAPRGEFSGGALRLKAGKKKAYISITKGLGLYRDLIWQASSEYEADDIRRSMGSTASRIIIAQNLPPLPAIDETPNWPPKERSKLRILFLSRISPKKNLDGALRILAGVKAEVKFSIYGPIRDEAYWRKCQLLIRELPSNVTVSYCGSVDHKQVSSIMMQNDLFLFPTHGENYGHVILEALVAGVPVLISNQTPWRDLEELGVGWDLPLAESAAFRQVMEKCASIDEEYYHEWRQRVRTYGIKKAIDSETDEQNRQLFLKALPENS